MTPLEGKRTRRVRIRMEDGTTFCLYEKEARRLGLEAETEMTDEVYDHIVTELLLPRAKKRALHLLERQDRTRWNLSGKLSDSGYPPEVVREALTYIESFGYVDDDRYARNYIRYHQTSRSRGRIREDLLKKGIAKDVIETALFEEYSASEDSLMASLLRKRHFDPDTADEKERMSAFRFLIGRGFSYEAVRRAVVSPLAESL